MPCTTILIGKNATYDGSTMMARNEDSGSGHFTSKKFIVVTPEEQPRHYQSVISGVEIDLPDDPMRYTAMPNATPEEGIWGEAGINICNVAMSETETITSNPRVLGADPLVKSGIGEEDFLTIVLPYIHNAREGVKRLGSLLEQFGTYEMNGIGFQDVNEIWWLETIGGHHWMAKRVPDDSYVVMPNQLGIDSFDFTDAFGAQKDHMCSADLVQFVVENHLDLSMNGGNPRENTCFDTRAAFGSHADSDHVYNTPRAWYMLRCLNPATPFEPEADDLPWSMVPEHKVTVEDVKYVLSSYFQGTAYNPYGKHGDLSNAKKYRPIGINRNNFVALTQLRPYVPAEIMGLEWIAEGSNAFNAFVPMYANVDRAPEYLACTDGHVTTDSFYWANRIIGALADAHFPECASWIERYQNAMANLGHAHVNAVDRSLPETGVSEWLAEQNDAMAKLAREKTDEVLGQVLYTASMGMRNGFARSDA